MSTENPQTVINDARNVIQNASGDCAKLLGPDALSRFDAIAGNIQFNGDMLVHVEGLGGGAQEGKLSDVPATDAVTVGNQIYLNPQGWSFNTYTRGGQAYHPLQSTFQKFGVTQGQYAAAVLLHEFYIQPENSSLIPGWGWMGRSIAKRAGSIKRRF